MRGEAALSLALAALLVVYGILVLLAVDAPLARFRGAVEGYIAITHYHVEAYGAPVGIPELDRARVVANALRIHALLLVAAGALTAVAPYARRGASAAYAFSLGVGIGGLVAAAVLSALLRVVLRVISELPVSTSYYRTSAGVIVVEPTTVTYPVDPRALNYLALTLSAAITALLAAAYVRLERGPPEGATS